jgi:hypothetical protein
MNSHDAVTKIVLAYGSVSWLTSEQKDEQTAG